MVNRIGLHHFGCDLVPTRGNFFQSVAPTHPELLNWLADEFVHKAVETVLTSDDQ